MFGAKIAGGGCGGVVCVLTADTDDAERAVGEGVCEEYGGKPAVFVGSSPGGRGVRSPVRGDRPERLTTTT